MIFKKSQKNMYAYTSSAIRLFESINLLKKSVTTLVYGLNTKIRFNNLVAVLTRKHSHKNKKGKPIYSRRFSLDVDRLRLFSFICGTTVWFWYDSVLWPTPRSLAIGSGTFKFTVVNSVTTSLSEPDTTDDWCGST